MLHGYALEMPPSQKLSLAEKKNQLGDLSAAARASRTKPGTKMGLLP